MADLSWMRLLGGQRSRTAVRPSSSCSEHPASLPRHGHDGAELLSQGQPPSRTTSRLPSWPYPRRDCYSSAISSSAGHVLVNDADRVWYNPSTDQMIDALCVAMMTKPTLEPLSPRYNSYVLHLIESYGSIQAKLLEAEGQLVEAESLREQEARQFAASAAAWANQESRYKAEVKRLELVIHRTSGNGLEAVVMARSGSLVRRRARSDIQNSTNKTRETTCGEPWHCPQ